MCPDDLWQDFLLDCLSEKEEDQCEEIALAGHNVVGAWGRVRGGAGEGEVQAWPAVFRVESLVEPFFSRV